MGEQDLTNRIQNLTETSDDVSGAAAFCAFNPMDVLRNTHGAVSQLK